MAKINVQISVTENYETVFAYQSTAQKKRFVRFELLNVLKDFTKDVKLIISNSEAVANKEAEYLLTNQQKENEQ